jgi:carboxyl-terminal processing protease
MALRPRPVLMLIDEHTRDASELLAAVLKGRESILLLGSATHGDARIRREIALSGDEHAFMATGRAIPFGSRAYDKVGVQPDITVARGMAGAADAGPDKTRLGEPLTDRARLDRERTLRIGGDPALTRAVDILLALKALQAGSQ